MKGKKANSEDYPKLTSLKELNRWQKRTITVAISQGVSGPLTPSYAPTNPIEQELLREHGQFLFTVFEDKVKVTRFVYYIDQWRPYMDGKRVWEAISNDWQASCEARYLADDHLKDIDSRRLNLRNLSGKITDEIYKFNQLVIEYNEIAMDDQRLTDPQIKAKYDRFIDYVVPLHRVRQKDHEDRLAGLPPMDAATFLHYLIWYAEHLDRSLQIQGRRSANATLIEDDR